MAIDLEALVRVLREHPEQRAALRQALLGEEADVAAALARLAQAQERTETRLEALTARVDALAQAQHRTEAHLAALAQAQERTEARLEALTARVEELAKDLAELARRQAR
ncbi:MAG: hypothetical protein M3276_05360, partial [Actinomycetota bacterium]|nr:hypothetical protein [Actinomycetota bacterium]